MIALPFACSHHCLHHLSCCHHDDDHFPGVPTHSLIWPLPWSHPLPSHSCTSWSNIWGWCKRPFNQVINMVMIRRGAFYRCCPDQDHRDQVIRTIMINLSGPSWSLLWAGKMRRLPQPVQLQLCHYQAWGFFWCWWWWWWWWWCIVLQGWWTLLTLGMERVICESQEGLITVDGLRWKYVIITNQCKKDRFLICCEKYE